MRFDEFDAIYLEAWALAHEHGDFGVGMHAQFATDMDALRNFDALHLPPLRNRRDELAAGRVYATIVTRYGMTHAHAAPCCPFDPARHIR